MRCPSCRDFRPLAVAGPAVRRPVEALRGRLPVTLADERRVVCPRCSTVSRPALLSTRCPACATPIVRELGGEVRPGALVPFVVDRERAVRALGVSPVTAVFVPVWVFDLVAVARRFTDVVVPGVKGYRPARLPAPTVPFRAEYLSGVATLRYTVPLGRALDRAKASVGSSGTTYSSVEGDLVLLPYWIGGRFFAMPLCAGAHHRNGLPPGRTRRRRREVTGPWSGE
ncbi:hypothetical protein HerbRD11066_65380 [Herbidospora sp. RD11066]